MGVCVVMEVNVHLEEKFAYVSCRFNGVCVCLWFCYLFYAKRTFNRFQTRLEIVGFKFILEIQIVVSTRNPSDFFCLPLRHCVVKRQILQ